MYAAAPAPRVEPATAQGATYEAAATAETAQPVASPQTDAAPAVEPAVANLNHAPKSVTQPSLSTSSVSVAVLRGGNGADLECYAAVLRGASKKNLLQILIPCIYDERDFITFGEVKKYILVKAGTCFVFGQETDPSPLYAIPLDDGTFTALIEDRNSPNPGSMTINPLPNTNKSPEHLVTVLLKYQKNGKQAYQFTFDTHDVDKSIPKRFLDLVEHGRSKQDKGVPVTASVAVAGQVAAKKMQNQPNI